MLIIIQLVLLLLLVLGFAAFRVPIIIWIPSLFILFTSLVLWCNWSLWLMLPVWLLFLTSIFIVVAGKLRRQYITKPLINYLKKHLPTMSQTERDALEAGDVWIEGNLFQGQTDWRSILTIRKPQLTEEEQAFIDNQVTHLCAKTDDWQTVNNTEKDLSKEVWQYIKKEGFLGLVIPKKFGGKAFSAYAHSCIITKIASRSVSTAVTVMVPNSLGPGELLMIYGTDKQKQYHLPRLASGKDIPCFALTTPDAGSDAASIADKGIVCKQTVASKEVLGIKLSWDKRYITLAPIATLLGLAFKLYDPDALLGSQKNIGITLALIPTNLPGVEIGNRHAPMGLSFMNGTTRGKDVFIPIDAIIGGQAMAGKGWKMLMEALSIGRSISIPALATAICKLSYRSTGAYARIREQFKTPIGYFEGVEEALSRIGGLTYMTEATRSMTSDAVGQNIRPSLVSAITKYHNSENCRKVINDAMDIHAGKALQLGPNNYLGLAYQAVPISITVEGANILTRNLIIFGQGALRCHPYIRAEMDLAYAETAEEIKQFDKLLLSHAGYTLKNFAGTFLYGLSAGKIGRVPKVGIAKPYIKQLNRMSSALAFVSDIIMIVLGGKLKRKERLSARLGDVLSQLYIASAVVKYYHDNNCAAEEACYVEWSLQYCLNQIQIAFDDLFANLPSRALALSLRQIVFPWGRCYRAPSDKLSQKIARSMLQPSAVRDRLSEHLYIDDGALGQMESALSQLIETDNIKIKLRNAISNQEIPMNNSIEQSIDAALTKNIINKEEAEKLLAVESLRQQVIAVDEFSN